MIVNCKQVTCSKAGCPNKFWIDEEHVGLAYCTPECYEKELEGQVAVFDDESPNAGVYLEGGTDGNNADTGGPGDIPTTDGKVE